MRRVQHHHVRLSAVLALLTAASLTGGLALAGPAAADPLPPPLGPSQSEPAEPTPSQVDTTEDKPIRPGEGEPILAAGDEGRAVKVLQVRLQRVGVRDMPTTGLYGKETVAQVKSFQKQLKFARTGAVDEATLKALEARTGKVDQIALATGADKPYGGRLPASCLRGKVVCVDQRARTVRWVVNGKVKMRLDARFGSTETPTREGVFVVQRKSRDHVSSLYHTSMPFALFFDGGQAVHYSPDFARRGYAGASHGCVNTRDYNSMETLFGRAKLGDRVVVYTSRSPEQLQKNKKK
ncbi:L,D-transpeptidase family protein [Sporichthya polymorpha]|uniref:L,D-transpeptidase family protein n=1 Tax=Sporichthya polymorpha TaxID=35751 RepID=UPI000362C01C|nr:L,D-transpeptidase family protein [Sporichthya polymorpha]